MSVIGSNILAGASGAAGVADPVINDLFNTTLYRGTGSASTITNGIDLAGEGGLVWIKERDSTESHNLFDTERGATKYLKSDSTDTEYTANSSLSAFNSDGFSHGGGGGSTNQSSKEYVAWTFRKAPKFFDVVTYTGNGTAGRQIAHSLGSTPGMVIVKSTSNSENWAVWHRSISNTQMLQLHSSDDVYNQSEASTNIWNSTTPTATHFTLGDSLQTNQNGYSYVAYIFAHDDLIQCGGYTGNNSTNSINVGFEAQFVIVKRTDTTGHWVMHDAARSAPKELRANDDTAEHDSSGFSFSSTGFTLTDGSTDFNSSGGEYIYIAIKAPNTIDYSVGTYYPMFAVKPIDVAGDNGNGGTTHVDCEVPFRRALSFDTNNTSPLYGNESVSDIIDILDDHKYTCNADFGASGNKISGIMIRHYKSDGTLHTGGEASFEFDSTNFNIYDNACNATALGAPSPDGTGSLDDVTRACGTISNVSLSGHSGTAYAYLNQSSQRVDETQHDGTGWGNDLGDYCFLGVGTVEHLTNTDTFDRYFSGNNNTDPGLAFGISDSEGRGTGSETTPREGIARRGISYPSLITNCLEEKSGAESSHSGHTTNGYFIVYGKYLSA